jgi:hypothetical protein
LHHLACSKSLQILKVLFGFLFIALESDWIQLKGWTLRESLACAGLPALVYALQNILLQVGHEDSALQPVAFPAYR